MKNHKHEWKRTGVVFYTMPPEYEEKCNCGKKRWIEGNEKIPVKTLSPKEIEEYKKKYPNCFKL
jgi:hypothetical protein